MTSLNDCIEKLGSKNEAERIFAAEDLGYANQGAGVHPLLMRLPVETSRAAREAMAGALLQMDHEAVIVGVLDWLDSEDAFLRNEAVEILGRRASRVIPYLEQVFRSGNSDRRKFVLDVLTRSVDTRPAKIYELALNDDDLNVVIAAVENLAEARDSSFRERIEDLVTPDSHPMLLCVCLDALARLGDARSVDLVRERLGAGLSLAAYLQPFYLKLLGAAGQATSVVEIARMLPADGLGRAALTALTELRHRHPNLELPKSLWRPLRGLAFDGSWQVGYQAIRLLAALPCEDEILTFLEHCLKLPHNMIRIATIQSLHEIGTKEAKAIVRGFLDRESDEELLRAINIEGLE